MTTKVQRERLEAMRLGVDALADDRDVERGQRMPALGDDVGDVDGHAAGKSHGQRFGR